MKLDILSNYFYCFTNLHPYSIATLVSIYLLNNVNLMDKNDCFLIVICNLLVTSETEIISMFLLAMYSVLLSNDFLYYIPIFPFTLCLFSLNVRVNVLIIYIDIDPFSS